MTTAADLINHILNMLGVGENAPERLALLGSSELAKINLPEQLAPRLTAQLLTKDLAKKDEEVGRHYRAITLGGLDSELEAKLTEIGKLPANWAQIKSTTPKTLDRILSIMSTPTGGTQKTAAEKRELMRLKMEAERLAKKTGQKLPEPKQGDKPADTSDLYKRQADYQKRQYIQAKKELDAAKAQLADFENQSIYATLEAQLPKDRIKLEASLPDHLRKTTLNAAFGEYAKANKGRIALHEGKPTLMGEDGKPLVINGADGKPLAEGAWINEALKSNGLLREPINNPKAQPTQAAANPAKPVTTDLPKPLTPQDRAREAAYANTIKV